MSDQKRCAVCGQEYDAAYDGCPRCANRREWAKAFVAVVVMLALFMCCAVNLAAVG